MRDGTNIRGINTAATLWSSAAVGAMCGAGLNAEAALLAFCVLAGNIALRPIVNGINRLPFNERTSEARYQVHITVADGASDEFRDVLVEKLEAADYPVRVVNVYPRSDRSVEIVATLVPTAVNPEDLDRITGKLSSLPKIVYATWTQRTMD
jgi:putative Mg2+ transporter-C (MgtC) family protein